MFMYVYFILQTEFDVNCFLFSFNKSDRHYFDTFHCSQRKLGEIVLDPYLYVCLILRLCLNTSWEKFNSVSVCTVGQT